ncbi:MAG: hypothetical protein MSS96_08920 [Bacteroidales bacterium]|nr:hypothetical protein [Bacteroidales bacterium]
MIIRVANPIYDSVFKYLMEDERIARTILSALLKKEVVEVQIRRNEYTNGYRDNISMFRIDFGARVRQDDGSLRLVLIELQKTWLETETLRFRQYLGAQYSNPENMVKEELRPPYGLPMVAVYILGHRVGKINVPVLYVNHKPCDYEGREVTEGLPDPFVDSLVHESIIVQIPLLHGQINNRLDRVLSVFDQANKEKDNRQVVELDDANYEDDSDMQYILHRLVLASVDAQLRQDMNVEDEYFQAIEDRDTAIMSRDKQIKEKDEQLSQQSLQLSQQIQQLSQQSLQLSQQIQQLSQQIQQLSQQSQQLAQKDQQLSEQGQQLDRIREKLRQQGLSDDEIEEWLGK